MTDTDKAIRELVEVLMLQSAAIMLENWKDIGDLVPRMQAATENPIVVAAMRETEIQSSK